MFLRDLLINMYIQPRQRGRRAPRNKQNIPNLAFGLNDRQNPEEIENIEMADCENVAINEAVMKSAPGWESLDQNTLTNGPFYGIYSFVKSDNTGVLLRMRQNILEYSDGQVRNKTWTACTMPSVGSPASTFSFTDGKYPSFVTLNDTVLISNGTDSVLSSTDGISWTEQSSLPKAKWLFNNGKNRVIFAAQPDAPSRIDWSDINDPVTVGATSFQFIEPNDGQQIIGGTLTPWGSTMIFKTRNIYELSDVDFGLVDVGLVASNTSLRNPRTIATTENSVMFMGYDGVYEYIGGQVRYIMKNIKKTGRNYVLSNEPFCAAYFNKKYRLSMPDTDTSDTYNSQEYVFYRDLNTNEVNNPYPITRNKRYIGCYGVEDVTLSGQRYQSLWFGDSRTASGSPASGATDFGYINDNELTTAEGVTQGLNGSSQTCYFTTKFFTQNLEYYAKRIKRWYMSVKSDQDFNIKVAYRFDPFDSFTETTETITQPTLEWVYDDGISTGGWSEGYDWAYGGKVDVFTDLDFSKNKPRGIQFRITWTTTEPVTMLTCAYQYIVKDNFR